MKNKMVLLKLSFIFITIISLKSIESAKILAVFPFPGPSQYIVVQPFLKALAAKGHEVTSINAYPQKQPIVNFRDVPITEVRENYSEIINNLKAPRSKWEGMSDDLEFLLTLSETVLKNTGVQKLLKTEKFDLVLVETAHTDVLYALGRHFNVPIIGVSSFGTDPIMDELMGNTSPLSYTPLSSADMTDRMTFGERFINVIHSFMELLHLRICKIPKQNELLRKYFPHIKEDLWDIRANFSLLLLNQHFSLSYPRPYVPNVVEVGGYQIDGKTKPLPKEMLDFINSSSQDVIYFSMGSNIKSKDFPPEKLQMINEVFSSLPYSIMWKFENPTLPGKPKNVFISPWFPQTDVLAHPRVKLFISHGGLLSTTEAIYHGKPMLGLPVFYDQHFNIRKGISAGFALGIDFHTLPRDDFKSSILEIMTNPKYGNNAKKISKIYHDQPLKPLELAIFWTEYVLRHQGAAHLRNAAQKMNFITKHSIDTVGTLLAAVILCLILVLIALKKIIKLILKKNSMLKKKTN